MPLAAGLQALKVAGSWQRAGIFTLSLVRLHSLSGPHLGVGERGLLFIKLKRSRAVTRPGTQHFSPPNPGAPAGLSPSRAGMAQGSTCARGRAAAGRLRLPTAGGRPWPGAGARRCPQVRGRGQRGEVAGLGAGLSLGKDPHCPRG